MSLFEDLKPFMDAQVDDGLGDSIIYKIAGEIVETAPTAFLIEISDDGAYFGEAGGIQAGEVRWRMKIRKLALPERPSMRHEVTAAKLDGRYRPAANNPIDGGDYWIVDLQKAP